MIRGMNASFNLTLVECKFCLKLFPILESHVLISPQWNVNKKKLQSSLFLIGGLTPDFDTCTFYDALAILFQLRGFNLTLVECKFYQNLAELFQLRSFNLTLVECKYILVTLKSYQTICFNLTLVECKCHQLNT